MLTKSSIENDDDEEGDDDDMRYDDDVRCEEEDGGAKATSDEGSSILTSLITLWLTSLVSVFDGDDSDE